jgi:prepilin-type N-terminal cleavage/methylation domain-containing protein
MIKERQREHVEQGESGMTLIEVTVSLVILGVVLVGLGQALTLGIRMNSESKIRVANLNMCKYITENIKTQISQQAVFDGTAPSTATYYVDANGDKTYTGTGANKVEAFNDSSAYRVNVVISNGAYTKAYSGVAKVLVKILTVTVVDVQNRGKAGRDVSMKVEIIRPSTSST